ncbi:MAG: sel1 repeat family protein [Clostridia bacterium]|nr:sel1 repeat family protein [Clostridia bacterium]
MASYYKPCPELDRCNELIEKYYLTGQYEQCFAGHLALAQEGYALAECQVGYFYLEGLGVEKDLTQAFYWTKRAAEHGDRDAQCNLAELFYEAGMVVERDLAAARRWYEQAAAQGHDMAIERLKTFP